MSDVVTGIRHTLVIALLGATAACGGGGGNEEPTYDDPLMYPANFTETAPESFLATFETSNGTFAVQVHRDWAPVGADRFYNLARAGFYDDTRIFRAIDGFMAQMGIHGTPIVQAQWSNRFIDDDPVAGSNTRGMVTFAKTNQPNTRSTQFFINFADNTNLDELGFAPFGEVMEGLDVVDAINKEYGDTPNQNNIKAAGNEYLDGEFPNLTRLIRVTVE